MSLRTGTPIKVKRVVCLCGGDFSSVVSPFTVLEHTDLISHVFSISVILWYIYITYRLKNKLFLIDSAMQEMSKID